MPYGMLTKIFNDWRTATYQTHLTRFQQECDTYLKAAPAPEGFDDLCRHAKKLAGKYSDRDDAQAVLLTAIDRFRHHVDSTDARRDALLAQACKLAESIGKAAWGYDDRHGDEDRGDVLTRRAADKWHDIFLQRYEEAIARYDRSQDNPSVRLGCGNSLMRENARLRACAEVMNTAFIMVPPLSARLDDIERRLDADQKEEMRYEIEREAQWEKNYPVEAAAQRRQWDAYGRIIRPQNARIYIKNFQ